MGGVAAVRNAGPALAAIGIAFGDEPAVLGALAAVLLSGLAAALPIAAVLSHTLGQGHRLRHTAPSRQAERFRSGVPGRP